jgi:hypothetical protein
MAELDRLAHSRYRQDHTVERFGTEEAHPKSKRVVIVSSPKLPPVHEAAVGWNTVGFKSTAISATPGDYLGGRRYVRSLLF